MPSFGVAVAAFDGGRVLLHLREDARLWGLPGGHVEDGESLAEAAVREVREETGVDVALTGLVGTYSRPRWRRGGNHDVLFAARVLAGDPTGFTGAETVEARYFEVGALPDDLLWWHRRMIADAAAAGGAVAWSVDTVWPGKDGLEQTLERFRRDPDFAREVRRLLTTAPGADGEQLEAGSRRARVEGPGPGDEHPCECVAFLVVRGDRVLAERRSPTKRVVPGVLAIPGGHVEPGEALEAAVARELAEELAVTARAIRPVCTLLHRAEEFRRLHYLAVEAWEGEIVAAEAVALRWIDLDGSSELDLDVDRLAVAEYVRLYRPELVRSPSRDGRAR